MVRSISILALTSIALMVSGCKDDEPNRTAEYYLSNTAQREAKLAECEVLDNAKAEANCFNAQKASEIYAAETNKENRHDAIDSLFGSGS